MGPYIQDFFSFDSIFLPVQEVPDPGVQAIRVIGDGPPRGPGIGGEKRRIFGDVDFRVHTATPIRGRARPGENGRNFNLRSNFIGDSVIFSLTALREFSGNRKINDSVKRRELSWKNKNFLMGFCF